MIADNNNTINNSTVMMPIISFFVVDHNNIDSIDFITPTMSVKLAMGRLDPEVTVILVVVVHVMIGVEAPMKEGRPSKLELNMWEQGWRYIVCLLPQAL